MTRWIRVSSLLFTGLLFGQQDPGEITAAQTAVRPATASKGPQVTLEQIERFLQTADIVKTQTLSEGTTKSFRVTMTDGRLTHDAHVQPLDIYKPVWKGVNGTVEKNFRDTYKFNVAAYRLGKLLGLDSMIPASVERDFEGKPAAYTWWADDVAMTEEQRRIKQIKPPASQFWIDQLNKVKVFDQLIYNMDRNQGNLLITSDWKLYMIDHTRAFRTSKSLLNASLLTRCDYALLNAMRSLTLPALQKELGPFLRAEEINALLARRDVIVKFFDSEVRKKGDEVVLTGLPRSTPVVSVP
jgi:hypothetical protein